MCTSSPTLVSSLNTETSCKCTFASTPARAAQWQTDRYWGQSWYIWNNDKDTASLYDNHGNLLARWSTTTPTPARCTAERFGLVRRAKCIRRALGGIQAAVTAG
jgi:hypothetical protein